MGFKTDSLVVWLDEEALEGGLAVTHCIAFDV